VACSLELATTTPKTNKIVDVQERCNMGQDVIVYQAPHESVLVQQQSYREDEVRAALLSCGQRYRFIRLRE
jgi:hypothetical protein